jgi:hypothetical protein
MSPAPVPGASRSGAREYGPISVVSPVMPSRPPRRADVPQISYAKSCVAASVTTSAACSETGWAQRAIPAPASAETGPEGHARPFPKAAQQRASPVRGRVGRRDPSTSPRRTSVEEIIRLTAGRGVDVAIEALGRRETFESAVRVLPAGSVDVPEPGRSRSTQTPRERPSPQALDSPRRSRSCPRAGRQRVACARGRTNHLVAQGERSCLRHEPNPNRRITPLEGSLRTRGASHAKPVLRA